MLPGELDAIAAQLNSCTAQDRLTNSLRRWHTSFNTELNRRGANREQVFRLFLQQLANTLNDPLLFEGSNTATRYMTQWCSRYMENFPLQMVEGWQARFEELQRVVVPPSRVDRMMQRRRELRAPQPTPEERANRIADDIRRDVQNQIQTMEQNENQQMDAAENRVAGIEQANQAANQMLEQQRTRAQQEIDRQTEELQNLRDELNELDEDMDETRTANIQLKIAIANLEKQKAEEDKNKLGEIIGTVIAIVVCIVICEASGGTAGAAPMKDGLFAWLKAAW